MNRKGWNWEEVERERERRKKLRQWNGAGKNGSYVESVAFSHCCEIMFVHARIFLDFGNKLNVFEAHKHTHTQTHMQMPPIECDGNDEDDHFVRVRERVRKEGRDGEQNFKWIHLDILCVRVHRAKHHTFDVYSRYTHITTK